MRKHILTELMTLPRKLRTLGYIRMSTEQQAQEGISLDAQRTKIQAHCVSQEDAQGHRYLAEASDEQRAIRCIVELYEQDVLIVDICRWLTWEGFPPRGDVWHAASVLDLIRTADPRRRAA